MATSAGEINQTRYLCGAQERPDLQYLNQAIDRFPALPRPEQSGHLVDDLLRRRCLRCHLGTAGQARYGDWRAEGCAACHMPYAPDGLSHSRDKALKGLMAELKEKPEGQKRGYPIRHGLSRAIPTQQCLTCHNGHRVGLDFVGLAERDYEESYRFFSQDGEQTAMIYGFDPRNMTPDIHYEKGLGCLDCHGSRDAMGSGKLAAHSMEQVTIRCRDCHGVPGGPPKTKSITSFLMKKNREAGDQKPSIQVILDSEGNPLLHTRKDPGGFYLYSKLDGRRHRIPQLAGKKNPLAHRITEHITKMECHSCHALWSFQDLGFHLMREDRADYEKWAPLWIQNDPQVQSLLQRNLPLKKEQWGSPLARDYLDRKLKPGIWYSGFSYRRFESPIFGLNERGKTSVFRPFHQFVISYLDEKGKVRLDSFIPRTRDGKPGLGFNPYAPHTIRRETLRCEGCHGNPRALGLGNRLLVGVNRKSIRLSDPLTRPGKDGLSLAFEWEAIVGSDGRPLQTQTRPGARPYNRKELNLLSTKSDRYKGYATKDFMEQGLYPE
jgi:hypothetical protein